MCFDQPHLLTTMTVIQAHACMHADVIVHAHSYRLACAGYNNYRYTIIIMACAGWVAIAPFTLGL